MDRINGITRIRPVKPTPKVTHHSPNNSNQKKKKKKKDKFKISSISKEEEDNNKRNKSNLNKESNYQQKLNSSKIINDTLTFIKLMYEIYKEKHPGQQEDYFYHLAQNAVISGYKKVKNTNINLPLEIDKLLTQSRNRTLKRLMDLFQLQNGDKPVQKSPDIDAIKITGQIENTIAKIISQQINSSHLE